MAKKLSEMSPWERVLPRLKGLTNEEAEEIAVRILAQVLAKHVFIHMDSKEYFEAFCAKLFRATFEYAKENAFPLAFASASKEFDEQEKKKGAES